MADPAEIAEDLKKKYQDVKDLRREIASEEVVSFFAYREARVLQKKLGQRITDFLKTVRKQDD